MAAKADIVRLSRERHSILPAVLDCADVADSQRLLGEIEAEAQSRWPLSASLVIHRFGRLEPGDRIVLVATASAHRQAAFESCQFLIDWLKTKAPFWKLEDKASGAGWVEARGSDDEAAARWAQRQAPDDGPEAAE